MDTKLLDKLRKVLALAKSGVEGEAQNAAAILAELLTKHNLSMADLEKKGAHAPSVAEKGHDLGKAAFTWKMDLAEAVAEFYYCHPLVDRRSKTVAFIGRPDNVESLTMLYAWIIEQIRQIASEERKKHQTETGEHIDPLRWQVNFGIGAVERLRSRLEDKKAEDAEAMARNAEGDVVALALHHETENQDYMEQKYGFRTDGKETARERKNREDYEKQEKQKADWLARDPEAYYKRYPYERPLTPAQEAEQQAERDREQAEWDRRERRNEKARERRANQRGYYGRPSSYNPERERQEEQAHTSKQAGRKAAERINLEPFLNGHVPNDGNKRIKKGE
jgi:hypothetical protein